MFPSSPNTRLTLLKLDGTPDTIGNRKQTLISSKEVIGMNFSVTSKEFYESKKTDIRIDVALRIQSFLYDGSRHALIDSKIYKIERTYISGQFIELYFVETRIKRGDIIGLLG
jgi:hypothetical protein